MLLINPATQIANIAPNTTNARICSISILLRLRLQNRRIAEMFHGLLIYTRHRR